MPAGAVYVGRPTKWGNPFVVGARVTAELCGAEVYFGRMTAAAAVALFRFQILKPEARGFRDEIRGALEGKDLVCWCPLGRPCHADVLLEIANPRPRAGGERRRR